MPPRPKKPNSPKPTSQLLESLSFLSTITKDEDGVLESHVLLKNRIAIASNGKLSAGCPIEEDLFAAPNNKLMVEALKKCGHEFAITQLDEKLSIKSGKFKATIPCLDPTLIFSPTPDAPQAVIDDRFKAALLSIESVKVDEFERLVTYAFLMNGRSVIATDGKIIIEHWHGIELPVGPPIPKTLIPTITKNTKKLAQFGCSNSSVTFYFEDGSWVKSQLYAGEFPAMDHIINREANPFPVPADFFKGLEAVAPFSPNGNIYFDNGIMRSHNVDGVGANYEVEGLPKGPIYNAKYLSMIKDIAKQIDFVVPGPQNSNMLFFFGDSVRGVISGYG